MGGNGRKEESALKAAVNAQTQKALADAEAAKKPDEFEARRREQLTKWDDWRSGKNGPVNIYDIPDATTIPLYQAAKASRDAGRLGRGMATMESGANPAFATALDKEMGLERDLAAAGMLEGLVTDRDAAVSAEMGRWADTGNSRAMNLAQLSRALAGDAAARYKDYRSTKQPSFLKQLALGALSTGGQIASAPTKPWALAAL